MNAQQACRQRKDNRRWSRKSDLRYLKQTQLIRFDELAGVFLSALPMHMPATGWKAALKSTPD